MTKQIKIETFLTNERQKDRRIEEKPSIDEKGPYKLPRGWKWVRLKDILRQERRTINPQDYPDKEFFLVTMDCIESDTGRLLKVKECRGKEIKSTKYKFNANHILYGKLRPYLNKVYIPKRRGICTTEFIPFLVKGAIRKYIAFYLRRKSLVSFAMRHITGTRQPRVIISALLDYPVPLPPLDKQKRIVACIKELVDRAEEAMELRRIAREEAEKIMQAALHKAFRRSKEEGWKKDLIGNRLVDIRTGTTPPSEKEEYYGGNITWLTPGDMGRSKILTESERTITRKAIEEKKAKIFKKGTVLLVGIGATVGKVGIAGKDLSTNQQITGMVFDSSIMPAFAYYWFLYNQESIRNAASRSTLPIINQKDIQALNIVIPSYAEQRRIVSYFDRINETVESLQELQRATDDDLEELVPAVLDRAFRGSFKARCV